MTASVPGMERALQRIDTARREVDARKADLDAAYAAYYEAVAAAARDHGYAAVARELNVSRQYVHELAAKADTGQ